MLKPIVGGLVGTLLQLSPAMAQIQERAPLSPQDLSQALTSTRSNASISPLELQQFVQVLKQLKKVEMETQEKMVEVLKKEKLSPQRFQEIGQHQSNPDSPLSTEISPTEQQRFDNALAKIQTIQEEAVPKQKRAIALQGLTVERFNQIGQAINKNPALKQQLQDSF